MKPFLNGLPFYRILRGVFQAIWGSPRGSGAALREEGFEAKLQFCLFSEVECVYLGGGGVYLCGICRRSLDGRYLFKLTLELEEKRGLVSLKIRSAVVILAGRDERRLVYSAGNVNGSVGPGHRRRRGRVARADAECKSSRF